MAKKKAEKIIIAKVAKPKRFDLSFTSKDENVKIIEALANLKVQPGWIFLTQVFEANIQQLEKQIIEKIDETGKAVDENYIDVYRKNHGYLKELLSKPDYFIKNLSVSEKKEQNLDPYQ